MGSKGNRNSSSGYKINKNNNMNNNKGYKTERPKSNKRSNINNNNCTLIINQNNKNNGIDIRRNRFVYHIIQINIYPRLQDINIVENNLQYLPKKISKQKVI